MEELLINNHYKKIVKICEDEDFEGFDEDLDPIECIIMNVKRINIYTVQIIEYLLNTFSFSNKNEYILNLLERSDNNLTSFEKRVLQLLLEHFENSNNVDTRLLNISKNKGCLDVIMEFIPKDINLLNKLGIIREITKQLV